MGMAGKAKHRAAAAALGPKTIDRTEAQAFNGKSQRGETIDHQRLTSSVGRAYRSTGNQLLGQSQSVGHQKRSTGGWRRRVTHETQAPKAMAPIQTPAGMASPRNSHVPFAPSPPPVITFAT